MSSEGSFQLGKRAFGFTTLHMFYGTTIIAASIALFEMYSVLWLPGVICFWLVVAAVRKSYRKNDPNKPGLLFTDLAIVVMTVSVLICCGAFPISSRGPKPESSYCQLNVRQIVLAMLNYHSSNLHYPPACSGQDENGRPMHSWRILLLPYLEEDAVFNQYDFNEPWDGPNNRKLVDKISPTAVYFCPGNKDHGFRTGYKVVVGNGTAFEEGRLVDENMITNPDSTIFVVEDHQNPVCWMQPDDLTIEQAIALFSKSSISKPHHIERSKFHSRKSFFRSIGTASSYSCAMGVVKDLDALRSCFLVDQQAKYNLDEIHSHRVVKNRDRTIGYLLVVINVLLAFLPCFWSRLGLFRDFEG